MSSKASRISYEFGVIGEDHSDAEAIKELIRNVLEDSSVKIRTKGYGGYSQMMRKGRNQLELFRGFGCDRFIVCRDADRNEPSDIRDEVIRQIIKPAGLDAESCVVVPVQEFEAWVLADLEAVCHAIKSWNPRPHPNPEKTVDPKECLIRLSRAENKKPLYSPPTHNPIVARHLNTTKVYGACPSFRPLFDFLKACVGPAA